MPLPVQEVQALWEHMCGPPIDAGSLANLAVAMSELVDGGLLCQDRDGAVHPACTLLLQQDFGAHHNNPLKWRKRKKNLRARAKTIRGVRDAPIARDAGVATAEIVQPFVSIAHGEPVRRVQTEGHHRAQSEDGQRECKGAKKQKGCDCSSCTHSCAGGASFRHAPARCADMDTLLLKHGGCTQWSL